MYPARPTFPHILGRDGIGMIETLGAGVTEFKQGEKASIVRSEIGVSRNGTFAERVAVPVESLVTPPPDWTDEQSAGATLVYLTAYQAITQWLDLPAQSGHSDHRRNRRRRRRQRSSRQSAGPHRHRPVT